MKIIQHEEKMVVNYNNINEFKKHKLEMLNSGFEVALESVNKNLQKVYYIKRNV